jgi:hypothetical protein
MMRGHSFFEQGCTCHPGRFGMTQERACEVGFIPGADACLLGRAGVGVRRSAIERELGVRSILDAACGSLSMLDCLVRFGRMQV